VNRFTGTGLVCRRSERPIFSGLDFGLESGGALLLHGPNGSGKSSLLRMMAGLLRPFAGRFGWDGAAIEDDPAGHRSRLAYLGHQDALKPVLTVLESVRVWTRMRGRGEDAAIGALAIFALGERADMPVRFLSAGQRRRVALARVVAGGAPLWLLDEPSIGLDLGSIGALETAMESHRAAGGMVVAATHAPLALPDADRLDLARFRAAPSA
jgi:heme exporter protein A